MKKRIQVKTSRKQVLYLCIELFFLIVFPIIVLSLTDNDIILIISLIIMFSMAIWMCYLCIKDGKIRYNEALRIETEKEAFSKKLESFMDEVYSFNYKESDDEQKIKYLIYYLYTSCLIESPISFYQRTKQFKKTEIKRLFKLVDFSNDFKDFYKNVMSYKLISPAIYRFEYEMIDLIEVLAKLKTEKDPFIEDEKVVYDYTKHIRCRVIEDRTYKVEKAYFEIQKDYWNCVIEDKEYHNYHEAYQRCLDIIKQTQQGFNINDFFAPHKYLKEEYCWDYMIDDYDLGKLDEPLNTLCSYYLNSRRFGHFWIFQNIVEDNYYLNLKKYVSKELYDLFLKIKTTKRVSKVKKLCQQADEIYKNNERSIHDNLQKMAIDKYIKLIKDNDIG